MSISASSTHGTPSGAGLFLGLTLILVASVAAGGLLVARREVETRLVRDRQAQRALASTMQGEVRKLEELYDRHLVRTGERLVTVARNEEAARKLAQNIEGISQVSWLYWKSASPERHLVMGSLFDAPVAEPTLQAQHPGLPRSRVLLEVGRLFPDPADRSQGWIDEPGKPLMFYVQVMGSAVVFTIHRAGVEKVMTGHLKAWLEPEFKSVEKLGGPDAVQDSQGQVLALAGDFPDSRPDELATVISRFGVWSLASWDQRVSQVSYHVPTLAVSLTLAVLVAGCGIGLSVQQRRAARLARQRVSFVNRVSHELRTPMTNILLNLDVIEEAVPEEMDGRFSLVREEAGRLSRLIENVLTFSRQEEGRLKMQDVRCQPQQVVGGIVRQFEPALGRRGIVLTSSQSGTSVEAWLDADALSQITANLLSNVEKYAPNASATVHSAQKEDVFILTVADAGPGIATEDAERVFEPFYRVDDRVEAGVSGAGLGLSIARDLARSMGGELRLVASKKGACFELTIPLTRSPDQTHLTPPT